ncbi:hypothetical protein QTP88_005475 [Uroleucon formosanum]
MSFSTTSACGGLRAPVVVVVPNRSRRHYTEAGVTIRRLTRAPHLPTTHPCGAKYCILVHHSLFWYYHRRRPLLFLHAPPDSIAFMTAAEKISHPPTTCGAGVPVRVTVALQQESAQFMIKTLCDFRYTIICSQIYYNLCIICMCKFMVKCLIVEWGGDRILDNSVSTLLLYFLIKNLFYELSLKNCPPLLNPRLKQYYPFATTY